MSDIQQANMVLFDLARELYLPTGEYVITGSGPLGVRGLRAMSDVDILVSKKLWDDLAIKYEVTSDGGFKKIVIDGGKIECFCGDSFPVSPGWPTPDEQITNAEVIDGLAFQSLEHLKFFKLRSDRDKDKKDLALLEGLNEA